MKNKLPLYLLLLLSIVIVVLILWPVQPETNRAPVMQADTVAVTKEQRTMSAAIGSRSDAIALESTVTASSTGDAEEYLGAADDLNSSADNVVYSLAQMTDFSVAELQSMSDVQAFSERFINMATAGLLTAEQNDSGDVLPVNFSAQPADAGDYMSYATEFGSDIGRIFANFSTVNYAAPTVIAKWYRSDVPEVYSFRRYPVDALQAENYVWFQPDGGWSPGEYGLDIISADEDLRVLASGRFVVR